MQGLEIAQAYADYFSSREEDETLTNSWKQTAQKLGKNSEAKRLLWELEEKLQQYTDGASGEAYREGNNPEIDSLAERYLEVFYDAMPAHQYEPMAYHAFTEFVETKRAKIFEEADHGARITSAERKKRGCTATCGIFGTERTGTSKNLKAKGDEILSERRKAANDFHAQTETAMRESVVEGSQVREPIPATEAEPPKSFLGKLFNRNG